ncbi:MAG TPA: HAMP domain-containing protein [Streptosporangiaceae bacterium]|nr:HAMP domain-containing protein [Streptosporangiaceae bacterium]
MLVEILFAALVLVVAGLMVLDVARTPSENPLRSARDAEPAITGASRGIPATASFQESAAPGMPAVPREPGPARSAESPSAPGRPPARTSPAAVRERSSRALKNWHVRSRLLLLAGIPTAAVAVVAFCVVRLIGAVDGTSIHSTVSSVRDGAIATAIGFGAAAVIVLVLAAWAAAVVARSVLRPLGRLRAGALELPEAVRRISESNGHGAPPQVRPIDVDSADELGEVARAFDQMRTQTLRMAANEAVVRGKLNTMLMNLSHRSQSLAERQIRLIDSLGLGEQDAGRLASLSKMDRIAARMHRGSQNLLVLAGREPSDQWNQPVVLANVVAAAVSEIEDSERVSFGEVPEIAVRGPAVNDVVHLLAELTENATSFSSGDMPVDVSSRLLPTGGALVEITDRGIGMAPNQMAQANWQLENVQAVDVDIPKWMGLFVVARLAARHGVRVRLHPAEYGGLTALVWLPDEILTRKGAAAAAPGPAASLTKTLADSPYATAQDRAAAMTAADFAPQPEVIRASAGGWPASDARQPTDPGWSAGDARQPSDPGWSAGDARHPSDPGWSAGEPRQPSDPGWSAGDARHPSDPAWSVASLRSASPAGDATTPAGPAPARTEGRIPAFGSPSAWNIAGVTADDPGPLPVLGSPDADETEVSAMSSTPPGTAAPTGSAAREVIVPPAEGHADTRKLPIFDEMESRWFGAGRTIPGHPAAAAAGSGWASSADEGWRAAQTADAPTSVGSTAAGLPRRMPAANLIPGAIPAAPATPPLAAPTRSAAEARDRMAGFQRGVSEGRAAADEATQQAEDDQVLAAPAAGPGPALGSAPSGR